ncbi:hypothetical protein Q3G72_012558 [Acer saccharum]|nr:hypothetical protein Q3G72_012558 [Acer saccharum]
MQLGKLPSNLKLEGLETVFKLQDSSISFQISRLHYSISANRPSIYQCYRVPSATIECPRKCYDTICNAQLKLISLYLSLRPNSRHVDINRDRRFQSSPSSSDHRCPIIAIF